MEREILFRGKRVDNGECVYGHFCEFPCDDGKDIPSILRIEDKENERIIMQHPIISETVGRFTGLTDRNGVKIFDGDIVRSTETSVIGIVQWFSEHSAFMIWCKSFNKIEFLYECAYVVEVIGNIHDNSEMLKGEK